MRFPSRWIKVRRCSRIRKNSAEGCRRLPNSREFGYAGSNLRGQLEYEQKSEADQDPEIETIGKEISLVEGEGWLGHRLAIEEVARRHLTRVNHIGDLVARADDVVPVHPADAREQPHAASYLEAQVESNFGNVAEFLLAVDAAVAGHGEHPAVADRKAPEGSVRIGRRR